MRKAWAALSVASRGAVAWAVKKSVTSVIALAVSRRADSIPRPERWSGPHVQLGPLPSRSQGKGKTNRRKNKAAVPSRCRNQRGGKRASRAKSRAAAKATAATRSVCSVAATAAKHTSAASFQRGSRRPKNEEFGGGTVKASVIAVVRCPGSVVRRSRTTDQRTTPVSIFCRRFGPRHLGPQLIFGFQPVLHFGALRPAALDPFLVSALGDLLMGDHQRRQGSGLSRRRSHYARHERPSLI